MDWKCVEKSDQGCAKTCINWTSGKVAIVLVEAMVTGGELVMEAVVTCSGMTVVTAVD